MPTPDYGIACHLICSPARSAEGYRVVRVKVGDDGSKELVWEQEERLHFANLISTLLANDEGQYIFSARFSGTREH
jgi:hypothetical protein